MEDLIIPCLSNMLACDSTTAPGNFLLQNQFEKVFKAPAGGCCDTTFVYTVPAPNQVRCTDTLMED